MNTNVICLKKLIKSMLPTHLPDYTNPTLFNRAIEQNKIIITCNNQNNL